LSSQQHCHLCQFSGYLDQHCNTVSGLFGGCRGSDQQRTSTSLIRQLGDCSDHSRIHASTVRSVYDSYLLVASDDPGYVFHWCIFWTHYCLEQHHHVFDHHGHRASSAIHNLDGGCERCDQHKHWAGSRLSKQCCRYPDSRCNWWQCTGVPNYHGYLLRHQLRSLSDWSEQQPHCALHRRWCEALWRQLCWSCHGSCRRPPRLVDVVREICIALRGRLKKV